MLNTEDHGSHQSSSNCGQARDIFRSSTSSAVEIPAQRTWKRKFADGEDGNAIGEAFIIKSHPSLPSPLPQKLIPRLRLPRSRLPLAYLDPLGNPHDLPGSNLFSARIEALEETVHDDRRSDQPTVLIAQSAADDGLFAIERVQERVYAMCRLGNWVGMNMLEQLQTVPIGIARPQKRQCREQQGLPGYDWWNTAAIDFWFEDSGGQGEKLGVERTRGLRLCLQTAQHEPTTPAQITQELSQPILQDQTEQVMMDMVVEAVQDPEEVFRMIRIQYQEALYASKSSLAYFAKGPLSRARATFPVPNGSANDRSYLTSFLRSCILPLATMDTKYRESLPELVKGFPFASLSDDECNTMIDTINKKSRKSKRISVRKNGLYPGEEAKIAQWWLSKDLSAVACDSSDAREEATRSGVLEQRARETQLQIILSLETLALESLATSQPQENLPPAGVTERDDGSQSNKKKKKPAKKPQDLSMLLDLLIDRLCIWQSMSVDETKASNSEDRSASQQGATAVAKSASSDHLRQFCVDVVLPFYGARLPELTTLLCQKLGGPKQPSPRRRPLMKSASSYASLKPGASVQRLRIRKPRRTLERVLTDERFASQKLPPSLSRSATDPVLPQVKREVSDTSLSSIPLNRVAMHKRYSQREIDLHARTQATEARLKKTAKVEQELQGAIAALKKPNPRMAVKELVEDAERRAAASHSRKPKNPVSNPFAQGAQVMATPNNNRHKDVYGGLPSFPRQSTVSVDKLEEVPTSGISCVPSSSRKAPQSSLLARNSTRKGGSGASPFAETPTRGPSKLWGRDMESVADIRHPSPILAARKTWPFHVHETPRKSRCLHEVGQPEDATIDATPVKVQPAAERPAEISLQAVLSPSSREKGESIYAALGWDDEIDELL